ncbi:MAG: hypothetical protein MZV64_23935 [Ignavibacteriales bacterium]|nr:hypothetical protein [Ignavibacteriales bacterium]
MPTNTTTPVTSRGVGRTAPLGKRTWYYAEDPPQKSDHDLAGGRSILLCLVRKLRLPRGGLPGRVRGGTHAPIRANRSTRRCSKSGAMNTLDLRKAAKLSNAKDSGVQQGARDPASRLRDTAGQASRRRAREVFLHLRDRPAPLLPDLPGAGAPYRRRRARG